MPPRILVVDDDPGVRSTLCRYLHQQGCSVEVAANGVEGLAWIGMVDFDAIVTDIQMPSMDGAEFWWQAVALHPLLGNRFVFCSALPVPTSIPREHAVRFLCKPFQLADLWTAVVAVLSSAPPTGESGAR